MHNTQNMQRIYTGAIILIMLLALGLRLYYVWSETYEPLEWDQLEYTKLAIQWLEQGIYAYRDTVPNTLVTPGWPAMLYVMYGLFGYDPLEPTLMIIRTLNCFINVVAIWFIYKLGVRLFHPAVGLLAALFAAVYPSYIWSTSLILTEVPFLTLFTAFLYMQVKIIQENRPRDHLVMGLLLAACVLIRPNVLPLAIVPYLFLWVIHRRLFVAQIVRGAGAFALLMLPWWIRNAVTFHEFIPIAKGEAGNPFLGGTDPYFRGTIDWTQVDEQHQFQQGLERIKRGLKEEPWLWIKWFTVGKFKVFYRTLWVGPYQNFVPAVYFSLLSKLHYAIVYIGWTALPVFSFFHRSFAYLTVSLLIFYGVHALFIPVDRYLYGMLPFLMLGTAQVAVMGLRWLQSLLDRSAVNSRRNG
ncbi:glycosyltransferase family 39 protein [Paenibacillus sp. J2TS4]|uniref:ArnT family glycosyltransferase n=1 Tax=Paenibacillus sp. J2TS4 TaxID=2807194 RepID=UPI0020BE3B11|nr:glycosyltransferase family 39 protein [Paenibacillus sp. J2TS4]